MLVHYNMLLPINIMRERSGWLNLRRTFPLVIFRVAFCNGSPNLLFLCCTDGVLVVSAFFSWSLVYVGFLHIETIEFGAEAFVRFRSTRFYILLSGFLWFDTLFEVHQFSGASQLIDFAKFALNACGFGDLVDFSHGCQATKNFWWFWNRFINLNRSSWNGNIS